MSTLRNLLIKQEQRASYAWREACALSNENDPKLPLAAMEWAYASGRVSGLLDAVSLEAKAAASNYLDIEAAKVILRAWA